VGPFARRVPITVAIDPASATARYRGGFLYVTFRKGGDGRGDRRQITIER
jgi:HSP20 family molecular chaperone IbpA